jgi:hypothetical protein
MSPHDVFVLDIDPKSRPAQNGDGDVCLKRVWDSNQPFTVGRKASQDSSAMYVSYTTAYLIGHLEAYVVLFHYAKERVTPHSNSCPDLY